MLLDMFENERAENIDCYFCPKFFGFSFLEDKLVFYNLFSFTTCFFGELLFRKSESSGLFLIF